MINDFISIGKVTSTFGLKGFLKVASSGDILFSLKPDSQVYVTIKDKLTSFKILKLRKEKNLCILSLEGLNSIEDSEGLIGKILYYPKKDTQTLLEPGEYFTHQLLGLHPYNLDQVHSDYKLQEVLDNPAHPILLFSDGTTEILVPYINQFVGKVDLENKRIEILNWEDWILAD